MRISSLDFARETSYSPSKVVAAGHTDEAIAECWGCCSSMKNPDWGVEGSPERGNSDAIVQPRRKRRSSSNWVGISVSWNDFVALRSLGSPEEERSCG